MHKNSKKFPQNRTDNIEEQKHNTIIGEETFLYL
jgi:hypothetical protein